MAFSLTTPRRLDRFAAVQATGRRERQDKAAASKAARHAEQRARAQELDALRIASRPAQFLIQLFLGNVPLSSTEVRLPDTEAARAWAIEALSSYGPHLDPRATVNGQEIRPAGGPDHA